MVANTSIGYHYLQLCFKKYQTRSLLVNCKACDVFSQLVRKMHEWLLRNAALLNSFVPNSSEIQQTRSSKSLALHIHIRCHTNSPLVAICECTQTEAHSTNANDSCKLLQSFCQQMRDVVMLDAHTKLFACIANNGQECNSTKHSDTQIYKMRLYCLRMLGLFQTCGKNNTQLKKKKKTL